MTWIKATGIALRCERCGRWYRPQWMVKNSFCFLCFCARFFTKGTVAMPTYADELRRMAEMLDDNFAISTLRIVCDQLGATLQQLIKERDRLKKL